MNFSPPLPPDAPSHTFLLRLWCEPAQPGQPGEWRGSIEHAATHEKRYFRDADTLSAFIRRQLGCPADFLAGPPLSSRETG